MRSWTRFSKTGPDAKPIATVDEAKEIATASNVAFLGLFKDLETKAAKQYLAACQKMDDLHFGITTGADVLKSTNKWSVTLPL